MDHFVEQHFISPQAGGGLPIEVVRGECHHFDPAWSGRARVEVVLHADCDEDFPEPLHDLPAKWVATDGVESRLCLADPLPRVHRRLALDGLRPVQYDLRVLRQGRNERSGWPGWRSRWGHA